MNALWSAAWSWFFYGSLLTANAAPAELLWTVMALAGCTLNILSGYDAWGDLFFLRGRGLNGARALVATGQRRNAAVRGVVKLMFLILGLSVLQAPPSPTHSTAGKVLSLGALVVIVLLTWADYRQRRDREKLLYLMAHRRSVIDPLVDGVLTIDRDSAILRASPGIANALGWSPGKLIGASLATILAPDEYARHRASMTRYLTTGEETTLGRPRALLGLHHDGYGVPLEATFFEVGFGAARRWNLILRQTGTIERQD